MSTINFDKALTLFIDAFLERHPKPTWPAWFRTTTTYGGQREASGDWRLSFTASKKPALRPGESWEISANGAPIRTRTDPQTGEKSYIISDSGGVTVVVFEARVHQETGAVTVLVDQDLHSIDGESLLPMRK